jgi:hypothetical protein
LVEKKVLTMVVCLVEKRVSMMADSLAVNLATSKVEKKVESLAE